MNRVHSGISLSFTYFSKMVSLSDVEWDARKGGQGVGGRLGTEYVLLAFGFGLGLVGAGMDEGTVGEKDAAVEAAVEAESEVYVDELTVLLTDGEG